MTYSGEPATTPLNQFDNCILDASGAGTCMLEPPGGAVVWQIGVAAVQTVPAVLVPTVKIYMGPSATAPYLVDGTSTGDLDATSLVAAFPLQAGQKIFAVWSGGDVGATGTLSIVGVERTKP
jgi:hypothetical protein